MRRSLFAAASIIALAASPAIAQEAEVTIDDTREEPVDTATADDGAPANIIIGSTGRVTLRNEGGPAVRVNSDNDLTIASAGRIEILDTDADGEDLDLDGAVGVQVDPGVDSNIVHSGSIALNDSYLPSPSDDDLDATDSNGDPIADNEADGPFARDRNKTGMLIGQVDGDYIPVAGQAPMTGDVILESVSTVTVAGQDSYGVRAVTQIDGDFQALGRITVRGERSTGVSLEGGVTGDVVLERIDMTAPEGTGAAILGDVGGNLRFEGGIEVSGYRISERVSRELFGQLEADDLQNAGSAIIIAGSLNGGMFLSEGARVLHFSGAGAGIDIGRGGETVRIGAAVLPDDYLAASGEGDEDEDPDQLDHAIVNQGSVRASGVYDGRNSIAFLIAGRDDQGQVRAVILEGAGFRNEGLIENSAFDASATALLFGEGASGEEVSNAGDIIARAFIGFDDDGNADVDDPSTPEVEGYAVGRAVAVHLAEGSALRRLINQADGAIAANVQTGSDAASSATAILIDSETVEEVENSGFIAAAYVGTAPEGREADQGSTLIAIDARNHTAGLTVRQTQALDGDGEPVATTPVINGDILFGNGDDTLDLQAGEVNGRIAFGAGTDRLILNGASINGAISDTDGDLIIDVTNGRIVLAGEESLALTDATFNDGGELQIRINTTDRPGAFVDASGSVTFASGSDLSVALDGLIGAGETFEVIRAGQLDIQDDAVLQATNAPYLYNAQISRSQSDPNTLILSLTQKTADELGMNAAQAAAYDEAFAAFTAVESLGAAFAGLRTAEDFFNGYNQLLPEYAASAIQFALANNDAASGALSARLRNARLAPDELAGVWAQEFGYFADRAGGAFGPGYRGQGVGLAIGLDRPVGPFYALGVSLVGSASEIEEIDGFDEPMVAMSGQLGTYAATMIGGFDLSGSLGVGYDHFETERQLLIGDFSSVNTAQWSGWHLAASAVAGRDYTAGAWVIRPEASLTWLTLFESGYEETAEDDANAPLALIVDDRESTSFSAAATMNIVRRFGDDRSWWAPHLRFGYRGEFDDAAAETTARFGEAGSPFTLRSASLPGSGYLLGFGLSAGSDYSTFTFAYDADVRDGFVRHVGRLVIRLTF